MPIGLILTTTSRISFQILLSFAVYFWCPIGPLIEERYKPKGLLWGEKGESLGQPISNPPRPSFDFSPRIRFPGVSPLFTLLNLMTDIHVFFIYSDYLYPNLGLPFVKRIISLKILCRVYGGRRVKATSRRVASWWDVTSKNK